MIDEEKLAAFIDGSADEEVSEEILRELSTSQESSREWLNCCVAASLAGEKPAKEANLDRAAAFVSQNQVRKFPIVRTLSVALAVAASLFAVALVFVPRWNSDPIFADNTQPAQVEVSDVSEMTATPQESAAGVPGKTPVTTTEQKAPDSTPKVDNKPAVDNSKVVKDDVSTASAAVVIRRELEMIHPSKSEYSVLVSHPERHFVFRWKTSGADYSEIILLDKEGNLIAKDKGEELSEMSVEAGKLLSYGEVHWRVKTVFEGGESAQETGVVIFTKAE